MHGHEAMYALFRDTPCPSATGKPREAMALWRSRRNGAGGKVSEFLLFFEKID
jgi:hypothetical protein